MEKRAYEAAAHFRIEKGTVTAAPYGNGHINDTFCVTVQTEDGHSVRYILQRVNRYVFTQPVRMIENIARVTEYLREVIAREGGDADRETLTLVKTTDGLDCYIDEAGDVWRVYLFVEGTMSLDLPDTPELFELSGAAFGRFAHRLEGFDAQQLVESIPDFHNTPARYRQLMDAIDRNEAGRLEQAQPEIEFCKARAGEVGALLRALEAGEIPLRVTHNDT